MGAERRGRSDDRSEVARVGHVVERHDQRRLSGIGRAREQVVGVGVLVRRHLQDQALVGQPVGQPVELDARRLKHRHRLAVRGVHGLAHPLVVVDPLGDVQRRRRNTRGQCLDYRVTADDVLGSALTTA